MSWGLAVGLAMALACAPAISAATTPAECAAKRKEYDAAVVVAKAARAARNTAQADYDKAVVKLNNTPKQPPGPFVDASNAVTAAKQALADAEQAVLNAVSQQNITLQRWKDCLAQLPQTPSKSKAKK